MFGGGGFLGFILFGLRGCIARIERGYKNPFDVFAAWESEAGVGIFIGVICGICLARIVAKSEANSV
jgi:hypothetical protein